VVGGDRRPRTGGCRARAALDLPDGLWRGDEIEAVAGGERAVPLGERFDRPSVGAGRDDADVERTDGLTGKRTALRDLDGGHRLVGSAKERRELPVRSRLDGEGDEAVLGVVVEFARVGGVDRQRHDVADGRPEFGSHHPLVWVDPPHLHEVARARGERRVSPDSDGGRLWRERRADTRRTRPDGEVLDGTGIGQFDVDVADRVVGLESGDESVAKLRYRQPAREHERLAREGLFRLVGDRVVTDDVVDLLGEFDGDHASDRPDDAAHVRLDCR
jgi:hypothetical protein